MEDEAPKMLAEQIVEKMNKSLEPLVAVLEDLAETNEILLGRIERLEFMLGIEDEPECTCSECSKPPMTN